MARVRTFFREPEAVFWTFVFPLLLAIGLGIAFRNRPPAPVFVGLEDGARGQELEAALAGSPAVTLRRVDRTTADKGLRAGKLDIVVVPDSPVVYVFDPTRPESRVARLVVDQVVQRAAGRTDPEAAMDSPVSETGSRYIDFLIPGLLGMGLMQSGFWGVGYAVVEMRSRKLIKRLAATPMRRSDFLLSFLFSRAVFLVVELPVLLGFGSLAFGVPVRGSLLLLIAVAILGALVFASLGLMMAARATKSETVSGLINLASLPMFVASGTFFSSSRFPDTVQPLIKALPLTALNDALRAVMLEGAGVGGIAVAGAILVAWGVVGLAVALATFRWQ
jgi:ABC-type multidrug transport system permease subunit